MAIHWKHRWKVRQNIFLPKPPGIGEPGSNNRPLLPFTSLSLSVQRWFLKYTSLKIPGRSSLPVLPAFRSFLEAVETGTTGIAGCGILIMLSLHLTIFVILMKWNGTFIMLRISHFQ